MNQRNIALRDLDEERTLFGSLDRNLHLLRKLYRIEAVSRGGSVRLSGEIDAIDDAARVIEQALDRIRNGRSPDEDEIEKIFRKGSIEPTQATPIGENGHVLRSPVEPRTPNQAKYLKAIKESVVTFGLGPAGTGKSFLAVAMAVAYLRSGLYRRIVLCRPAVEAGESLGFLPGDLAAKINPYLRPLYDALNELLPRGQLKRYIEEDVIEILPLAYMRGRTLDHAVIILDEAQNCTNTQMKMALTRLGNHSKMIVTGDLSQVDLPGSKPSGLHIARRILAGIDHVTFVNLSRSDIVRHPVVAEIVRAYGREEEIGRQGQLRHQDDEAPGDHEGDADQNGRRARSDSHPR